MRRNIEATIDNWDVKDGANGVHLIQVRVHFKIPHGTRDIKHVYKWITL